MKFISTTLPLESHLFRCSVRPEEGKLVGISSRDAAVVFTKVVRIGSSLDDAIAVYGREYVENPEDYSAVQYNMFRFFPQDLSLKSWITSNSPKQHFHP